MKQIRFGIVGTNFITDRFIEGLQKVEGATLSAVYSRTKERAESFAKQYGIQEVFTDLQEMAASDVIDAVYIASPNALHKSQSILFLNHQKHVLCEKAFASNRVEVEEMMDAAKANDRVLMEAMKTLSLPNYQVVKNYIGEIGKVRKYFASFCQYSSRYNAYREGTVLNAFKPELSNGALVDIGVYCIAPMVALFGVPDKIQASGMMLESGVDGEGSITFGYEGMSASVIYSKVSSSDLASEIQGEDGTIRIERINDFSQITLIKRGEAPIEIGVPQVSEDLCYEIQDFVNFIGEKNSDEVDRRLQNSKEVVKIMDEVRRQIGIIFPADKVL